MSKYYHKARAIDPYIYFRLLDADGKSLREFNPAGCHGGITYNMDTRTTTINVYRKKSLVPYNLPEIKRWVADLNEMGFPCEFVYSDSGVSDEEKQDGWVKETVNDKLHEVALALRRHGGAPPPDPNVYNFFVHLKDFVNKSHLFSTLQLLRVLYETNLSVIPERYFETLDKDPKLDKFQVLQDCHKTINGYSHAVTYQGNGKNVSRDTIMKRFKEPVDVFTGALGIYKAWNGDIA